MEARKLMLLHEDMVEMLWGTQERLLLYAGNTQGWRRSLGDSMGS